MKYWILSLFFLSSIASAQYTIQLPKALDIRISDGDTISFRSQGQKSIFDWLAWMLQKANKPLAVKVPLI